MSDGRLQSESDGEVNFVVTVGRREEEESKETRCTTDNY